ncbi:hypothetical protein [Ideonella sp. A 288]|uniref:hypothetical protein n=1 Tax=Ideonella sp. A 288 TaxID=1962181 RepID=UPI000B4BE57A|nr:hypothetical protein [Ideonella sp. A 288]
MPLHLTEGLSARRVDDRGDDTPAVCQIAGPGVPSGLQVDGALLEAAVASDGWHLLLLTHDTPYEDALSIHLFDRQWHLLDSARLGAAYTTGSFAGLRLVEPDRVVFRFFGDTDWTVQVLPEPAWRLPVGAEVAGLTRPVGWRRHFVVHGTPQPDRGAAGT